MKNHAKEYLNEYAATKSGWMKFLINEVIETNGNITQARLDELFNSFLNEKAIPSSQITQPINNATNNQKLLFENLEHISGVGALCENQKIKFSDSVTVLYGLNGSGKSSYFRILNEMCGGNEKKEILQNIYKSTADLKPIDVNVSYKIGSSPKSVNQWKPSNGPISDLSGVKIFDSSYLKGLLEARTPNEAVVNPLGIHLFAYLTKILDDYSRKLERIVEEERLKIPVVDTDDFQEEFKTVFLNRTKLNNQQISVIKASYNFTEEDANSLSKKQDEIKNLQQTNINDKISLLSKQINDFSSFVNKIETITNGLNKLKEELKTEINNFNVAKEKNEQTLKQSELLKALPKSDSEEWKSFIHAGHKYSKVAGLDDLKKCPYCNQVLETDAIKILQAYSDFLNDTSEQELRNSKTRLDYIKNQIRDIDLSLPVSEELKTCLLEFNDFQEKNDSLESLKKTLLESNDIDDKAVVPDFSGEIAKLYLEIQTKTSSKEQLVKSQEEKDKIILEVQEIIASLKQKKSMTAQKEKIEEYIKLFGQIDALTAKKKDFITTNITKLAGQASSDLLTATLEQKLQTELKQLGREDVNVHLKITPGKKGNNKTELILKGNNSINNILSEGEQKAVGLAVFFAEIQDENCPIVLDDPTNSLDHKIISKLSNKLLSMSNQIVLFTHHQFLVDTIGFIKKGHFCNKYGEQTCGKSNKHVFVYQIDESINGKGIIYKYTYRNSETMISKIESEIDSITSNDLKDIPKNMRKCVEYLIDEKILKEQLLRKYSSGQTIGWDTLKEVNSNEIKVIEKLHEIHQRVSGGEIHVDMESEVNPLTPTELQSIFTELKAIKDGTFR